MSKVIYSDAHIVTFLDLICHCIVSQIFINYKFVSFLQFWHQNVTLSLNYQSHSYFPC